MIHLDTNYLIGLLLKGSAVARDVDGWLAAEESLAASAIAWTEFLNSDGAVLGSNVIGRVTAAERGGVTGLSLRSTNGALPVGTRFVEFTLTNRVVTGMNDASADNLSFVLRPHPLPPFSITAHGPAGNGWQVEFTGRTNTANGVAKYAPVRLNRLEINGITVRDVEAAVMKDEALKVNLLGMSFLAKVKFTHDRGRLVLEQ